MLDVCIVFLMALNAQELSLRALDLVCLDVSLQYRLVAVFTFGRLEVAFLVVILDIFVTNSLFTFLMNAFVVHGFKESAY